MVPQRATSWFPLLAGMLILATVSPAVAFHDGGVASCQTCHTMHDSQDGQTVAPSGIDRTALLRAASASDLCLTCHASSLGAVLGSDPLMPPPEMGGGNFVFLQEDNLNDGPDGAANPIGGDAAGHNLNAPAFGLAPDGTFTHSPGGSYQSTDLGCTSCHDPHGNGNFRMLRDSGSSDPWGAVFVYAAPDAIGLDVTSGGTETNANHTAYRGGMSQWCANCHDAYLIRHNHHQSTFSHRTDRALGGRAARFYNSYNGTDDPAGGNPATAYLAAVPFEDSAMDPASTSGPANNSYLNCLTCHRAHATSGPRSGRWDFNVSLLEQDGVVSGSYPIPDPYQSPNQESLCHKCHSPLPH